MTNPFPVEMRKSFNKLIFVKIDFEWKRSKTVLADIELNGINYQTYGKYHHYYSHHKFLGFKDEEVNIIRTGRAIQ